MTTTLTPHPAVWPTPEMIEAAETVYWNGTHQTNRQALKAALIAALSWAWRPTPHGARDLMIDWAKVYRWDGGDATAEATQEIDILLEKLQDAGYAIVPARQPPPLTEKQQQRMERLRQPLPPPPSEERKD